MMGGYVFKNSVIYKALAATALPYSFLHDSLNFRSRITRPI